MIANQMSKQFCSSIILNSPSFALHEETKTNIADTACTSHCRISYS